MITGFPLAAFASGLKATYAEYLVDMLEYSPGTICGSRKKTPTVANLTIRQVSPATLACLLIAAQKSRE
jgi:hypothetical protein